MFLVVPLLLSGFAHLWSPTGFPSPTTDEGTYLGRAMNVLQGLGAQDPYYGYDHPYYGQLFLAAVFNVIGYSDSFNIPNSSNAQSFETLFLIPRVVDYFFILIRIGRSVCQRHTFMVNSE